MNFILCWIPAQPVTPPQLVPTECHLQGTPTPPSNTWPPFPRRNCCSCPACKARGRFLLCWELCDHPRVWNPQRCSWGWLSQQCPSFFERMFVNQQGERQRGPARAQRISVLVQPLASLSLPELSKVNTELCSAILGNCTEQGKASSAKPRRLLLDF